MLVLLFAGYAVYRARKEYRLAYDIYQNGGEKSAYLIDEHFTPPVGLNIFVIKNIAPDIPLGDIIRGVIPFVVLMLLAVVLICFFPGIATALPDYVMARTGQA